MYKGGIYMPINDNTIQEPIVDCCYHRQATVVNAPHSDEPAPVYTSSYDYNNDNTVQSSYSPYVWKYCPYQRLHPPIIPPCPCTYVTKHELNKILGDIANATIFNDETETGTTVTVGGIKKGTKLEKCTPVSLIRQLLYPENAPILDQPYQNKNDDGEEVLNTIVKYPYGDLHEGDDIKDMTISQILEALLCGKKSTDDTPTPDPDTDTNTDTNP